MAHGGFGGTLWQPCCIRRYCIGCLRTRCCGAEPRCPPSTSLPPWLSRLRHRGLSVLCPPRPSRSAHVLACCTPCSTVIGVHGLDRHSCVTNPQPRSHLLAVDPLFGPQATSNKLDKYDMVAQVLNDSGFEVRKQRLLPPSPACAQAIATASPGCSAWLFCPCRTPRATLCVLCCVPCHRALSATTPSRTSRVASAPPRTRLTQTSCEPMRTKEQSAHVHAWPLLILVKPATCWAYSIKSG